MAVVDGWIPEDDDVADDDEPSPRITSRDQKTEPKRGKSWCDRCDRNIIPHGGKCSVCGFRDSLTKHRKK